jgi:hypothetical protein
VGIALAGQALTLTRRLPDQACAGAAGPLRRHKPARSPKVPATPRLGPHASRPGAVAERESARQRSVALRACGRCCPRSQATPTTARPVQRSARAPERANTTPNISLRCQTAPSGTRPEAGCLRRAQRLRRRSAPIDRRLIYISMPPGGAATRSVLSACAYVSGQGCVCRNHLTGRFAARARESATPAEIVGNWMPTRTCPSR